MSKNDDILLINRYLSGELSEQQIQEFDERIQKDTAFADEVAFQIALQDSVEKREAQRLREIIQREERRKSKKNRLLFFLFTGIAAGLIAVACFLLPIFTSSDQIDTPTTVIDQTIQTPVEEVPTVAEPPVSEEKPIERDTSVPEQQAPVKEPIEKPRAEVLAPTPEENSYELDSIIWHREAKVLRVAGGKGWEKAFYRRDYKLALQKLESIINDPKENSFSQHYYFAAIIQLYHPPMNSKKALEYIREAQGYTRSDIPKHLIVALAKNGQLAEARRVLNKNPQFKDQLPPSLQQAFS